MVAAHGSLREAKWRVPHAQGRDVGLSRLAPGIPSLTTALGTTSTHGKQFPSFVDWADVRSDAKAKATYCIIQLVV